MASRKEKLEDISFAGFSVTYIETMERSLNKLVRCLHTKAYGQASLVAMDIFSCAEALQKQCGRASSRDKKEK